MTGMAAAAGSPLCAGTTRNGIEAGRERNDACPAYPTCLLRNASVRVQASAALGAS